MAYRTHPKAERDHLRNLVGKLSVQLLQQRARAAPDTAVPATRRVPDATVSPQRSAPAHQPPVLAPYVAAYAAAGHAALEKEALRTRSFPARNLLTLVATGGRHGYGGLAALLESTPEPGGDAASMALASSDPEGLLSLARVVSAQRLFASDDAIALSLYDLVSSLFGTRIFGNADWINFLGLLVSRGRQSRARDMLEKSPLGADEPCEYACLRANMLAAGHTGHFPEIDWLASVNTMFGVDGIEPISLAPGEEARIDRTTCVPGEYMDDGPLVSILMTNYCVGKPLETAVASVLGQSWRNLELIVVDDCSPDDEFGRLQQLAGADPRMRVYRTESNSGTYAARNLALSHARGEFVTCHDSDDWSHPRKIELQALDLLQGEAIGNLSRLVRASEDLWFERMSASGRYVYPNTSSLMFRREPVVSRLACWDPVRTGADTEFYKRLELAFGERLPVLPGAPLSFARTRATALTSGTLWRGWAAPSRRDYRAAWAHWHGNIKAKKADPMLAPDCGRAFPAPDSILPTPTQAPPAAFDVVILADMRCRQLAPVIAAELTALVEAGIRVAICHLPALRQANVGREFLDPAIQACLNAGHACRVDFDSGIDCGLLLIRDPAALQFSEGLDCAIRPRRVVVATNTPPCTHGSRQESYAISSVESAISRLFGQPATWGTGNLLVRDRLDLILPPALVLSSPWHAPSLPVPVPDRHGCPRGRQPVIGFSFPDAKPQWKDWGLLDNQLFPRDGRRVRVMGGHPPATDTGSDGWDRQEPGEEADTDFFAAVDFVPFFPRLRHDQVITAQLSAALAAGCIVLAPPCLAPLLGEGAVYVDRASARSLIDAYATDHATFEARSKKARGFARDHLSGKAYVQRIRQLLSGPATD